MEHELPEVLDGVDEPVSVEELEAVVRRAGQRRRATLVAGAAGLLALGALGGALARGPAEAGTRGLASEGRDTAAPAPSSSGMAVPALGFDPGLTLTPLFRRESNGVAIRAYEVDHLRPPPRDPDCGTADLVQAELSNAAAVGLAIGPHGHGEPTAEDPLRVSAVGMFGAAEGEPATWAIVETGKNVSSVRLKVGNATDAMAPAEGMAVLAVPGTSTSGVVEALGGDGAVVASQPLDQAPDRMAPPPGCEPVPCKAPPPPPPSSAPDAKAAQEPSVAPPPVADPTCGHPTCVSGDSGPPLAPPTTYPPGDKTSAVEPKAGTSSSSYPIESSCGPPVAASPAPVLTPPVTGTVPFTVAPAAPVTVAPAPPAVARTSMSAPNAAP